MDVMLVFSLLLIQDLSQQGFRTYDCHMQNYAEIFPENTKSISIILTENEKATREELTKTRVVATFQCSGARGPVQVRLMVSERKPRRKVKQLLQSLKQTKDRDDRGCMSQCCLVSDDSNRNLWRQREIRLIGKVLLPEVTHCSISSNETNFGNAAERADTAKKTKLNATCNSGLDEIQVRKKISLFLKIAILCFLIPVVLAFMVLIVCEVSCPRSCLRWMPKLGRKASEKKSMKITTPVSLGTSPMAEV